MSKANILCLAIGLAVASATQLAGYCDCRTFNNESECLEATTPQPTILSTTPPPTSTPTVTIYMDAYLSDNMGPWYLSPEEVDACRLDNSCPLPAFQQTIPQYIWGTCEDDNPGSDMMFPNSFECVQPGHLRWTRYDTHGCKYRQLSDILVTDVYYGNATYGPAPHYLTVVVTWEGDCLPESLAATPSPTVQQPSSNPSSSPTLMPTAMPTAQPTSAPTSPSLIPAPACCGLPDASCKACHLGVTVDYFCSLVVSGYPGCPLGTGNTVPTSPRSLRDPCSAKDGTSEHECGLMHPQLKCRWVPAKQECISLRPNPMRVMAKFGIPYEVPATVPRTTCIQHQDSQSCESRGPGQNSCIWTPVAPTTRTKIPTPTQFTSCKDVNAKLRSKKFADDQFLTMVCNAVAGCTAVTKRSKTKCVKVKCKTFTTETDCLAAGCLATIHKGILKKCSKA